MYASHLVQLHQQLKAHQIRACLLITGQTNWALSLAQKLTTNLFAQGEGKGEGEGLTVGVSAPLQQFKKQSSVENELSQSTHARFPESSSTDINAGQFKHHLGHEYDYVWFNGIEGFHPDAIAALSGTVKAGGLFILTMPTLRDWHAFNDPDKTRFTQHNSATNTNISYFLKHVKKALLPYAISITESNITCGQNLVRRLKHTDYSSTIHKTGVSKNNLAENKANDEQQLIIDNILHATASKDGEASTAHHVITAHRGRGKSSLLGMLAAQLDRRGFKVILTAPRSDCANQVIRWFNNTSPYSSPERDMNKLDFVPFDQLVYAPTQADILLIDEAAAIPTHTLIQLTLQYPSVIFSTTEHGYEGCGRGFSIRFKRWLLNEFRVSEHKLTTPIRWQKDDPLEHVINKAFLLNADPAMLDQAHLPVLTRFSSNDDKAALEQYPTAFKIRWLPAKWLFENESVLNVIFGLLIQAHYRTTPSDLRYMLDSETVKVVACFYADTVIAVLLVSTEGEIEADLAEEILFGRRRPKGHLLPQTIIAQCGNTSFAQYKGLRVIRIAVNPEVQHNNIGSILLDWLFKEASKQHVDYVGTSFGATTALIKFWQKNGYTPVRLGQTAETSTGEFSVAMIRPITTKLYTTVKQLHHRSSIEILHDMNRHYINQEPSMLNLLIQLPKSNQVNALSSDDLLVLSGFAYHHTTFTCARPALEKLLKLTSMYHESERNEKDEEAGTNKKSHPIKTTNLERSLTIFKAAVLKTSLETELVQQFNLTGKKSLTKSNRQAARYLLTLYQHHQ